MATSAPCKGGARVIASHAAACKLAGWTCKHGCGGHVVHKSELYCQGVSRLGAWCGLDTLWPKQMWPKTITTRSTRFPGRVWSWSFWSIWSPWLVLVAWSPNPPSREKAAETLSRFLSPRTTRTRVPMGDKTPLSSIDENAKSPIPSPSKARSAVEESSAQCTQSANSDVQQVHYV